MSVIITIIIIIIIIIISSQGDKQPCWNNTGGRFFSKPEWRFGLHVSAMNAELMAVLIDYPARGALAL